MISVVIPTYRKNEQFIRNLRQNMKYFDRCEVVIVNDYPLKSIKKDLSSFKIKLIENKENLGFGRAVNIGVKKTKNDYVVLLNSDVVLYDDGFKKALDLFKKDEKLFDVGFVQKEKHDQIVGKNRVFWKNGFLQHSHASDLKTGISAWVEGGACIIQKEIYLKLGGFDELYSPFYWEDIDLSYRAWKADYRLLFDRSILVEHFHESTISTYFTSDIINKIAYRNQFIFLWKNITDSNLLLNHVLFIIPTTVVNILKGNIIMLMGFFLALVKIPAILSRRKKQRKFFQQKDKEILEMFYE